MMQHLPLRLPVGLIEEAEAIARSAALIPELVDGEDRSAIIRAALRIGLPALRERVEAARARRPKSEAKGPSRGAKALARWRTRRRPALSQAKAAKRVGVRQVAWHQWERGERLPKGDLRLKIERLTKGAVRATLWEAKA